MAKIRVQKDSNFTIIKNNIFLERNISLKAKGLLTQMLSLPDTWDYTVAGLATLCRDGRDSITSALKELEKYGYVTRKRIRDEKGMLKDIEYIIREVPIPTVSNNPMSDFPEVDSSTHQKPMSDFPEVDFSTHQKPMTNFPEMDKPKLEAPVTEPPTQLNTDILNTNKSINNQSNQSSQVENVMNLVKSQINYAEIIAFDSSLKIKCDELICIITETLLSNKKTYRINNTDVSEDLVKKRFKQITSADIYYIINCLDNTTNTIGNMRQYLFTTLFNAPATRAFYYSQKAQQNLAERRGVTC